jgi:hypothetical protein
MQKSNEAGGRWLRLLVTVVIFVAIAYVLWQVSKAPIRPLLNVTPMPTPNLLTPGPLMLTLTAEATPGAVTVEETATPLPPILVPHPEVTHTPEPPISAPDASGNLPEMAEKPKPKQITFQGCPPEGDGGIVELNKKKNRVDDNDTYTTIRFAALAGLPGPKVAQLGELALLSTNERALVMRYEGLPIALEGYLVGVKESGPESCNCHGAAFEFRDHHLWLAPSADDDRTRAVVVETTPRVRAKHPHWDTQTLNTVAKTRQHVRISGWLMFDPEHPDQVGKTRATLWEIHPIMRIEIEQNGQWINLDDWTP